MLDEQTLNARFPRVRIANLPTPLEAVPRFGEALGGVQVWIKRDDLTGLALGGNKARKLEWLLGEALSNRCDCVITFGAGQSNHCRQTAAAAAKVGLDCYLVLYPPFHGEGQGNLLLDDLLGAQIVRVEGRDSTDVQRSTDSLLDRLVAEGRRPYVIPVGGSNPVGALGYVLGAIELGQQCDELGVNLTHVFFASGSAGTQSGLVVGARAVGASYQLIGISPGGKGADVRRHVVEVSNQTAALLEMPNRFELEDVIVDDRYTGPAYGTLTPECVEAIRLLARTEGILLDPVYAGKAMAGLIDYARRGEIKQGEAVAFIHTGGTPALFAYAAELADA